ncbi:2OG-Fe(II) oxygenase family protein [Janthinobacterium sp. PAMC25594]|uniref:2OG-Fe(II) oxygenase family protein n=1 Tax=Janthinobacterium sp. PAMC25594 TaxID=2861284 RepID=UPI001C63402B|nr:2OG-Fe(II) oxygenase family protein [Janthinobacterium sp. PAMC25594]QYG08887.1 2OG-Fe(II) oxygenase family protein [Janthinobacterium sp. PAMC25594]
MISGDRYLPHRARMKEGYLCFDNPDAIFEVLRAGCFALRIPDDFNPAPGIKLAREFYLDADTTTSHAHMKYRGYRHKAGIYFDRDRFQTEHILIDTPRREVEFPLAVNVACEQMYGYARMILGEILRIAGIDPTLWRDVTDGCIDGCGVQWFGVSHYRPERTQPGAPAHKDTGFITVLYFDQAGLEARIDGRWQDIAPVDGYFLVHFGGALEALTQQLPVQVHAPLHRVRQCVPHSGREDRFSFAAFLNPSADSNLYQVSADGRSASTLGSVAEFLLEFNNVTWQDEHTDFGIKNSVLELPYDKEAQE